MYCSWCSFGAPGACRDRQSLETFGAHFLIGREGASGRNIHSKERSCGHRVRKGHFGFGDRVTFG